MNEASKTGTDSRRELLRHILATLAYRGAKVIDGAPSDFASFRISESTRTAGEILSHICDLLDWAHSIARGEQTWPNSKLVSWDKEALHFFSSLNEFDSYLASNAPLNAPAEKLIQAPLADALTHVGQIALLRRVAGSPIRAENYFEADIVAGRVGSDQSTERVEFD